MINMNPSDRVELLKKGTVEYSTKFDGETLYLCPTVCGVKFCGWYMTTTECLSELKDFTGSWDGVNMPEIK